MSRRYAALTLLALCLYAAGVIAVAPSVVLAQEPQTTSEQATWHQELPACSCRLETPTVPRGWQATTKPFSDTCAEAGSSASATCDTFHPGASWEVRLFNTTAAPAAGQQCTYDQEGQLITGSIAAGTPDKWGYQESNNSATLGHFLADVVPFLPGWWRYEQGETVNYPLQWYLSQWPANTGQDAAGNACAVCNVLVDGICATGTAPESPVSGDTYTTLPWEVVVAYAITLLWTVVVIAIVVRVAILVRRIIEKRRLRP